jgi:integrase
VIRSEQRVQIFAIGPPKEGTPRDKRRYRVRWRVDGRDKTRSLKTKAEAERLQARLQVAVIEGEEFDLATGLPVCWVERDTTWWEWSREWLSVKWPQWAGHSRRSAVESLVALTPLMSRHRAPSAPDGVATWLRELGYRPGSASQENLPSWLLKWSVPLSEIDTAQLERVLTAVTTKLDGAPMSREVARRRRTTLNAVLRAAYRRQLIDHNPLDTAEWKLPTRNIAVDISTVPSYRDVIEIVDHVAGLKTDGARYATVFAVVGIAGMRPSEAIAVLAADLGLPSDGWGLAVLRGALTSPGTRFTSTGAVVEDKELKQRPPNATREVPLAPELVQRLRSHMERWPPVNGRVFTNAAGRAPTTTNYGPVWVRARTELWPGGHRLGKTTVYDLRHSAATTMLRAGVPPPEVARRLGHSVDILMRVYAGVFGDERQRSNEPRALPPGETPPGTSTDARSGTHSCGTRWERPSSVTASMTVGFRDAHRRVGRGHRVPPARPRRPRAWPSLRLGPWPRLPTRYGTGTESWPTPRWSTCSFRASRQESWRGLRSPTTWGRMPSSSTRSAAPTPWVWRRAQTKTG